MALRIVIVGPGRVGTACGMRLVRNGAELLGFVGRDAGRAAEAVRSVGAGAVLSPTAAGRAHVVLFSVGDPDLPAAIAAVRAAAPVRRCSLWVHTSGLHGVEVFGDLGERRTGCLHPVAPFAGAIAGAAAMVGAPGVYSGEARSLRLLRRLCLLLDLQPVLVDRLERGLYHAACATAANGLTALWEIVAQAFALAGLPRDAAVLLGNSLMQRALADCVKMGAEAALSGPVRRGDAATVALHLQRLQAAVPVGEAGYTGLMRVALDLSVRAGLAPTAAQQLASVLRLPSGTDPRDVGGQEILD